MTSGDQKPAPEPAEREPRDPVDFAFLDRQTFADGDLKRDVLQLFVAQVRQVVPSLPGLSERGQADAAHLLKGSARGIGAWMAAETAQIYEQADRDGRRRLYPELAAAFDRVEAAIHAYSAHKPV